MKMKREHDKFSLPLELLSLLPSLPHRALVGELGLNDADAPKYLVILLRMNGYQISLQHEYVWIPKAEWTPCWEAATRYLQTVYGSEAIAATC